MIERRKEEAKIDKSSKRSRYGGDKYDRRERPRSLVEFNDSRDYISYLILILAVLRP